MVFREPCISPAPFPMPYKVQVRARQQNRGEGSGSHIAASCRVGWRSSEKAVGVGHNAGTRRQLLMHARIFLYGALVVVALVAGCDRRPLSDSTIAEIDGEEITVREFAREFLFRPQFHPASKGSQAVREQYDKLVAEFLLAREAQRRKLHRDERIVQRLRWHERQAMREELYRQKVANQVQVSEAELRQAFVRRHTTLRIRHLVVASEEEAWRLRARLEAGEAFEAVAAAVGPQKGWPILLRWGEADPELEEAAYALQVGELSLPLKVKGEFHLIRLDDVSREAILTEEDFQAEKRRLERIIRARKEDRLAREYAAGLLKGMEVRVRGELFAFLVNSTRAALRDSVAQLPGKLPALRDEELGQLASSLQQRLGEPFVSIDGRQWTLGDFLRLVSSMPLDRRPHMHRPALFRQELQDLIRDEFLAEQADREGLAKHPAVRAEVKRWRRILLAARMRSLLTDSLTLSEQELHTYYAKRRERYNLSQSLEELGAQGVDLMREDALRAKADSLVAVFVAQLRQRAKIRMNEEAYRRAFEEVGGASASFIKVIPIGP